MYGVVTLLLGVASTRIVTVFNTDDFLPSGGETIRHIETLDAAFGGSTGTSAVLLMVGVPVAGVFPARVTVSEHVSVVCPSSAVTSAVMTLGPTLSEATPAASSTPPSFTTKLAPEWFGVGVTVVSLTRFAALAV